jgi:hypothetical protein
MKHNRELINKSMHGINSHIYGQFFSIKVPRTHTGEKIIVSINDVVTIVYLQLKSEIRHLYHILCKNQL